MKYQSLDESVFQLTAIKAARRIVIIETAVTPYISANKEWTDTSSYWSCFGGIEMRSIKMEIYDRSHFSMHAPTC